MKTETKIALVIAGALLGLGVGRLWKKRLARKALADLGIRPDERKDIEWEQASDDDFEDFTIPDVNACSPSCDPEKCPTCPYADLREADKAVSKCRGLAHNDLYAGLEKMCLTCARTHKTLRCAKCKQIFHDENTTPQQTCTECGGRLEEIPYDELPLVKELCTWGAGKLMSDVRSVAKDINKEARLVPERTAYKRIDYWLKRRANCKQRRGFMSTWGPRSYDVMFNAVKDGLDAAGISNACSLATNYGIASWPYHDQQRVLPVLELLSDVGTSPGLVKDSLSKIGYKGSHKEFCRAGLKAVVADNFSGGPAQNAVDKTPDPCKYLDIIRKDSTRVPFVYFLLSSESWPNIEKFADTYKIDLGKVGAGLEWIETMSPKPVLKKLRKQAGKDIHKYRIAARLGALRSGYSQGTYITEKAWSKAKPYSWADIENLLNRLDPEILKHKLWEVGLQDEGEAEAQRLYHLSRPRTSEFDISALRSEDRLAQRDPEWAIKHHQRNYDIGKISLAPVMAPVLKFLANRAGKGQAIVVHGRDGEIIHHLLSRMGIPSIYVLTPRSMTTSAESAHYIRPPLMHPRALPKEQKAAYESYLKRVLRLKGPIHVDTGFAGSTIKWLKNYGFDVTDIALITVDVSRAPSEWQIPGIAKEPFSAEFHDHVVKIMEHRPQRLMRPVQWSSNIKTLYGAYPGAYWARVYGTADALQLPRQPGKKGKIVMPVAPPVPPPSPKQDVPKVSIAESMLVKPITQLSEENDWLLSEEATKQLQKANLYYVGDLLNLTNVQLHKLHVHSSVRDELANLIYKAFGGVPHIHPGMGVKEWWTIAHAHGIVPTAPKPVEVPVVMTETPPEIVPIPPEEPQLPPPTKFVSSGAWMKIETPTPSAGTQWMQWKWHDEPESESVMLPSLQKYAMPIFVSDDDITSDNE